MTEVSGDNRPHGRMKRLSPEFYRGYAFVHWSMTMADRRDGWLDATMHFRFREILLHTLARYALLCPAYCLMPDHLHCIWFGLSESSDQDKAAAFFRRYLNDVLRPGGHELQKQPWDVVLREKARERDAVVRTCFYITANPVRGELVEAAADWPFSGAMAAGYPDLDWRPEKFAETLWRICEIEVKRNRGDA